MDYVVVSTFIDMLMAMTSKLLSPQELRVWHAFRMMGEDVLARVASDISLSTEITGPEFAVLSRLCGIGKGEIRQSELARIIGWDRTRLSHQLTRMQERALLERRRGEGNGVLVVITKLGREKLESARPVHAASVRKNLLSRLTPQQIETMVRISNLLGEED